MKRLLALLALSLVTALPGTASACDLCAIYRGTEAKESRPGFHVGVFEQFTHFGTLQEDGEEVANDAGQYMDSSITQVIAGYQFNQTAGVQVNVPFISRRYKRPDGFATDTGTVSGTGDMSLTGSYRVIDTLTPESFFYCTLIGGVKFPTGSSLRIKEELNEDAPPPGVPESGVHGHDLALGSGSWDGIIGASAMYSRERLFATASVQYAIRSQGDFQYTYADDLAWSVKPGAFLYVSHEATAAIQFSLSGETKGKDEFAGETAPDTAITSVFAGPELSFTWKETISADFEAEFPLVNDNSALQIVPDYKIKGALVWRM